MPHYATLKDYQFKDRVDDIRGETLYGVDDDKLGTIDDVIFEHGSGAVKYCVVDTGGWLSSHKFLVPAERIHSMDGKPDALQVDLLKEHIERIFPAYDENTVEHEDRWREYEGRYNRAIDENKLFHEGPVLHRKGSNRIVTPESVETTGGGGAETAGQDVRPHRLAGKFPSTMPGGGKRDMVPEGTRPVERTVSFGNESFVPPEGEQSFEATREFGNLDVSVEHDAGAGGLHERSTRHRHGEGKVEDISSSPSFRPADVKSPSPLGSMGEEIQPIAEPNAGRPKQPIVEVGAQKGPGPAVNPDAENMRPMRRAERWSRFEDLLRKNRVDIEAKCAQCAPARDRKAG
jgi:PRC-barrel domain